MDRSPDAGRVAVAASAVVLGVVMATLAVAVASTIVGLLVIEEQDSHWPGLGGFVARPTAVAFAVLTIVTSVIVARKVRPDRWIPTAIAFAVWPILFLPLVFGFRELSAKGGLSAVGGLVGLLCWVGLLFAVLAAAGVLPVRHLVVAVAATIAGGVALFGIAEWREPATRRTALSGSDVPFALLDETQLTGLLEGWSVVDYDDPFDVGVAAHIELDTPEGPVRISLDPDPFRPCSGDRNECREVGRLDDGSLVGAHEADYVQCDDGTYEARLIVSRGDGHWQVEDDRRDECAPGGPTVEQLLAVLQALEPVSVEKFVAGT